MKAPYERKYPRFREQVNPPEYHAWPGMQAAEYENRHPDIFMSSSNPICFNGCRPPQSNKSN